MVYPTCRSVLDSETWNRIVAACGADPDPEMSLNTLEGRLMDAAQWLSK